MPGGKKQNEKNGTFGTAGNMEKLRMALRYGADAVYLAGQSFGLRAFGGNFSDGELREAVEFTHSQGKKVYITVNIIPRNSDLERLEPYIKYIRDIGADADHIDWDFQVGA